MKSIKRFYEEDAEDYERKRFGEEETDNEVHQSLLANFIDELRPKSSVLEVGCGTGRLTRTTVRHGFDIVGVDFARNMLKQLDNGVDATDQEIGDMNLFQGDAKLLPFRDDTFDACIMINVASHLPDASSVMQEMSRVLRDGGMAMVNFPNTYSPYFPLAAYINFTQKSVQEDVYSRWYSWFEIRRILQDANFQVHRINGHMVPPRNKYIFLSRAVYWLDRIVRESPLKYIAGNVFVVIENQKNLD